MSTTNTPISDVLNEASSLYIRLMSIVSVLMVIGLVIGFVAYVISRSTGRSRSDAFHAAFAANLFIAKCIIAVIIGSLASFPLAGMAIAFSDVILGTPDYWVAVLFGFGGIVGMIVLLAGYMSREFALASQESSGGIASDLEYALRDPYEEERKKLKERINNVKN